MSKNGLEILICTSKSVEVYNFHNSQHIQRISFDDMLKYDINSVDFSLDDKFLIIKNLK